MSYANAPIFADSDCEFAAVLSWPLVNIVEYLSYRDACNLFTCNRYLYSCMHCNIRYNNWLVVSISEKEAIHYEGYEQSICYNSYLHGRIILMTDGRKDAEIRIYGNIITDKYLTLCSPKMPFQICTENNVVTRAIVFDTNNMHFIVRGMNVPPMKWIDAIILIWEAYNVIRRTYDHGNILAAMGLVLLGKIYVTKAPDLLYNTDKIMKYIWDEQ